MMNRSNDEKIKALCVLGEGTEEQSVLSYLEKHGVEYEQMYQIPSFSGADCDHNWDLILINADLEEGNIIQFFEHCLLAHHSVPIVAFHDGARGSRDTALIRMGAYDAFPKDIGRWNTEIYLDRALEQARMVKKLLSLSRTDHVTGLFNQRYLYESLEREMRRSIRTRQPLCIALFDIDNFKTYNDTHGHLAGDDALASVGHILENSIRSGIDSAYRYGGDEFMLIFPDTDPENAGNTLLRILEIINKGAPSELTFSVGIASLHGCSDIKQFIRAADMAMYDAKQAGGDRIVPTLCGESES